jgi:hypothetical protein
LAGLGLLYLTRRKLTADLARLVGRFGGGSASPTDKQRAFVWLWSLIFLPGTIVHEMSHLFAAAITGTKIGKVEILPELPRAGIGAQFDQPKKSVHLGYVQTQELGLFRGFLVGTAPLFIGLGLLVWLAAPIGLRSFDNLRTSFTIYDLLIIYFFFTISNSLFPSWVDIKHALPLIILGVITVIGLYFSGFNMTLAPDSPVLIAISSLSKALILSVIINFSILLILWLMNGIFSRDLKNNPFVI